MGLVLLWLVTGWLVPAGAPVVIAVDDTLFRRSGLKVDAAHWAYDGPRRAAPGSSAPLSRGNTFVVRPDDAPTPGLHPNCRCVLQPADPLSASVYQAYLS